MAYETDPEIDALIVVDVQKDFCPGGALPVPDGDAVVPVLNRWLEQTDMLAVATRDWHPPDHCSFEAQGGPWPPHCVRETEGAEFHDDLKTEAIDRIISKATREDREAYSGFDSPELLPLLRENDVERLWVGGLAAEYCVRETVLAGCEEGFEVAVIRDAVRGIEAEEGDVADALEEMQNAGAVTVDSEAVLGSNPAGGKRGIQQ